MSFPAFYNNNTNLWYNFATETFDLELPVDSSNIAQHIVTAVMMKYFPNMGNTYYSFGDHDPATYEQQFAKMLADRKTAVEQWQFQCDNPHLIHRWNERCLDQLREMKAQYPTYEYAVYLNNVSEYQASLMTDSLIDKRWMTSSSTTPYALVSENDASLLTLAGIPLINMDEITA